VRTVPSHKHRTGAVAALFAVGPSMLVGSGGEDVLFATTDPPSSIRERGEIALLDLEHERRRITSCSPSKEVPEVCIAASASTPSEAVLDLRPLPDDRAIRHGDTRKKRRVTLGGASPYRTSIRIERGPWEVLWHGASAVARIRVRGEENFAIKLDEVAGECIRREGRCRLDGDSVTRTIQIPPEHRLP
jgi:hypothetical protein